MGLSSCLACEGPRYQAADSHFADEFLCRNCQRCPATQIRVHLARARGRGMDFDAAWSWAFDRVRWPHDTGQRIEWKEVVKQPKIQGAFRAAYHGQPVAAKTKKLSNLAMVA